LPQKSPQFSKKTEKVPLNLLQKKKNEFPKLDQTKPGMPKPVVENNLAKSFPAAVEAPKNPNPSEVQKTSPVVEDVKIADLFVPLTNIKPGRFCAWKNDSQSNDNQPYCTCLI